MDDGFIAKPLDRGQIDQAFPLVRTIAPELTVERWRAYAGAAIGRRGGAAATRGIMTVQNDRGYIHGLFSYSVEENLRCGRILVVDDFIVLDLFDVAAAASTLLRSMDGLARSLSCRSIHTNFPEADHSLPGYCRTVMAFFRDEGHAAGALRLCKPVGGANDNRGLALEPLHDGA
ncbi:hypothetical protein [Azospirillum sp. ST 5-10]|uniref:hypothetical protein n=1 Tax=unclassified Azospirillum TaxID=2630922 RepID=UPI003F4A4B68